MLDDRIQRGEERLSEADNRVKALFTERGINADLAMQKSLSEAQARTELGQAYRDASQVYLEARQDIRNLNREVERELKDGRVRRDEEIDR